MDKNKKYTEILESVKAFVDQNIETELSELDLAIISLEILNEYIDYTNEAELDKCLVDMIDWEIGQYLKNGQKNFFRAFGPAFSSGARDYVESVLIKEPFVNDDAFDTDFPELTPYEDDDMRLDYEDGDLDF